MAGDSPEILSTILQEGTVEKVWNMLHRMTTMNIEVSKNTLWLLKNVMSVVSIYNMVFLNRHLFFSFIRTTFWQNTEVSRFTRKICTQSMLTYIKFSFKRTKK